MKNKKTKYSEWKKQERSLIGKLSRLEKKYVDQPITIENIFRYAPDLHRAISLSRSLNWARDQASLCKNKKPKVKCSICDCWKNVGIMIKAVDFIDLISKVYY